MKHRNSGHCNCHRCASIAAGATPAQADAEYADWERTNMRKYGWIVHFVTDEASATGFNAHMHGLQENCQHPDFQIVIPLPEKVAHGILINLVERVKAGERFEDGQTVEKIIGNELLVKLVAATECGRPVLRVILPDPDGNLEPWQIAEPYTLQYEDTEG